ncbi:MAG: thiamine ABC transporter substrate-binding protein [Actinobacteria bacterium]|nr:thiamine ABC transporter substrate-binding protein [Actinomycetota bacterium]
MTRPRRAAALATTALTAATIALGGCSVVGSGGEPDAGGGTVTLVTHDSFALSDGLLEQFTAETGWEVELVAPGDGGALVNQLILTKDSPLGDAVYGIDTTFASRAVDEGVLEPYASPAAVDGFDSLGGHLTAIDQGDVCLNVDMEWFAGRDLDVPGGFDDLLAPEYAGLTVVTNPATSSPGLTFLLATVAHFGEDGWQDYWRGLLANGAKVAEGWSDAYYVDFSGSEGAGPRPVVLSYSSSPAAEVGDDGVARTANVEATCFRVVEYAGVIAGAENPDGARALIDFLLSDSVQADIPGSMYMYPVTDVDLPAEWAAHAPLAADPLSLDPSAISANRATWLEEWAGLLEEQ